MFRKYILGLVLSLAAIGLFIKIVDWPAALRALENLNYWYLPPSIFFMALPYLFRMLRWRELLKPIKTMGYMPVFSAMSIGFLANNLLPAHLGEFVRAYLLGRSQRVSKSAVLATVVMERIYDGLVLLLMLLVVLLAMEKVSQQAGALNLQIIHAAGLLGAALFVGLMILMQVLRYRWQAIVPFIKKISGFLGEKRQSGLLGLLESFARGLAIAGWRQLLKITVYSLLVWLSFAIAALCLFPAFGLEVNLLAAFLLQAIISLAMLIPSAPAYVGTFQLAAVFTLDYLGADIGVAGTYAMLLWLVSFVVSTLIGLIMLWREGLSFKDLAKAEDKNQ